MSINHLKGEIMKVAPDKVEAIALWIYKGFNLRSFTWSFTLKELNINQLTLCYPCDTNMTISPSDNYPWRFPHDTMWRILPEKYKKLEYIYVFANPFDNQFEKGFKRIDQLINNCFNTLKLFNIKSIGLIHIPASSSNGRPSCDDNLKSAKQMIESINSWINTNNYELQVYLVDRTDDFANLI